MRNYTKAILTLLLISCTLFTAQAQVGINEDSTEPDASAILDISSTDKGLLIPRMTTAEREGISNPAIGLMVFDITTNSFWYYANTTWNNLNSTLIADTDDDTKIQVE